MYTYMYIYIYIERERDTLDNKYYQLHDFACPEGSDAAPWLSLPKRGPPTGSLYKLIINDNKRNNYFSNNNDIHISLSLYIYIYIYICIITISLIIQLINVCIIMNT